MRQQRSVSSWLSPEVSFQPLFAGCFEVRARRLRQDHPFGSLLREHLHNLHQLQLVQGSDQPTLRGRQLHHPIPNPKPVHVALPLTVQLRPRSRSHLFGNDNHRYHSFRLHLEK